jgi:hypothetical protein
LASQALSARLQVPELRDNFLDATVLGDRKTTVREHLKAHPTIMTEAVPKELAERYSG